MTQAACGHFSSAKDFGSRVFDVIDRIHFVIAGTQKGGTTALEALLRRHPHIGFADEKELHFFDDDRYFRGDRPAYAAYHAHFSPTPETLMLGEATPVYMYWEPAAERMWRYNPALKLIMILRNPIERAWSHWAMTTRRGEETLPFGEAIRREAERCSEALPLQHRFYSYVDRGFYSRQIDRLTRYFPMSQMLILRNEELRADAQSVVNRVSHFLGIPDVTIDVPPCGPRQRSGMPAEDRAFLLECFEPEIAELERRFGWDCREWRAP